MWVGGRYLRSLRPSVVVVAVAPAAPAAAVVVVACNVAADVVTIRPPRSNRSITSSKFLRKLSIVLGISNDVALICADEDDEVLSL